MTFSLIWCNDKEKWNKYVSSSPQGNIFCTTPFLDAVSEDYDLLFVEENGVPQIGAIIVKQGGKPSIDPFPYQGILFNSSKFSLPHKSRVRWGLEVTEYLLAAMEERYDRICFCLHPAIDDLRSFQWFHYHSPEKGLFRIELRYTAILDLLTPKNFDEIFSRIRKVRRYEYRRAKDEGLSVEESDDINLLNQLHERTFARQGIKRNPEDEHVLLSLSRAAISKGYGRLLVCKNRSGSAISASLFLFDDTCGYYYFGANDPEFRNNFGGTYLLLENIRYCKETGLSKVDLIGINSPNRGDFKISFNAKPVPYFLTTWDKPELK